MGLALIALIPILVVGVLMIGFNFPSTKAMPVGFVLAGIFAIIFWKMPLQWATAATLCAAVNTIDILLIVYGALLILQIMRKSGGVDGIAHSMASVSTDRRVQVIVIGFLMGAFFEGAAGYQGDFSAFLGNVGFFATISQFVVASLMPLAMVCTMTLITEGSIKKGLEVTPLALFGGLIFTIPQTILAYFVGPEIPSLLGALIAIPVFIILIRKGLFVPKSHWDFKPHEQWDPEWEGSIKAGSSREDNAAPMSTIKAWAPYILIGILLLLGRLKWVGLTPYLKSINLQWSNILGTSISRGITPLYNPGVIPFMLVALIIPFMHGLDRKEAAKAWKETLSQIKPAAIALFFALSMTYILMNSGAATNTDSMLIVMAKTAASLAGKAWYFVAPIVGILGSFVSGSATVSDIMFGALQFSAAQAVEIPATAVLALQAIGAAAGNMICVHNVVAVLTTVGLVGKEGKVIKNNIKIALAYGLISGAFAILIVKFILPNVY